MTDVYISKEKLVDELNKRPMNFMDVFRAVEASRVEIQKVEFIELYTKGPGGDYQWEGNHGELVRCRDCRYAMDCFEKKACKLNNGTHMPDWFCADGKRRDA